MENLKAKTMLRYEILVDFPTDAPFLRGDEVWEVEANASGEHSLVRKVDYSSYHDPKGSRAEHPYYYVHPSQMILIS